MRMVVVDADRTVAQHGTSLPRQRRTTEPGVSDEKVTNRMAQKGSVDFPVVSSPDSVRDVLQGFTGGRVVIALAAHPADNPPEPGAIALLVHDLLVEFGVREQSQIALVMPASEAADSLPALLTDSGIEWYPGHLVSSVDPERRVARFEDGAAMPFDLFLGIPRRPEDEV